MSVSKRYGARVYFYDDGVTLVKQTIKREGVGRYVVDTDSDGKSKEKHVSPGNDTELGETVRLAGEGKL